jgi:hypothetical protein
MLWTYPLVKIKRWVMRQPRWRQAVLLVLIVSLFSFLSKLASTRDTIRSSQQPETTTKRKTTLPDKPIDQSTVKGMLEEESQRELERFQKDRPQP